jgi:hypothetical protein
MVQSHGTRDRTRELLDWAREDVDPDSSTDDHESTSNSTSDTISVNTQKKTRIQKEIEELERWLEGENVPPVSEDPWIKISSPDGNIVGNPLMDPLGMTTSPMGVDSPRDAPWMGMQLIMDDNPFRSGFDDDFTVFVSAPAPSTSIPSTATAGLSRQSTPNASFDSDTLDPVHTGASYASLGSVSDFGDHRAGDEDIDDVDLPSEAEIQATSTRIFGSALLSPTSAKRTSPARPAQTVPHKPSSASSHPGDDDDYEVENFDLSRVLGALQNIKQEISGMEDEDERRRAAARAALGVVYGLERQRNSGEGEPL